MKNVVFVFLLIGTQMFALNNSDVQVLQVSDKNNELLAGAKVELVGTGKTFYTNSKGQCYIPTELLNVCKTVKIDCISYKTISIKSIEVQNKIVLEER
jgi:predicted nucleotidyltransferase